ncbi:MAG TPA: GDSL-type esterase/lipase family protein [Planctomycetota bacterium]|nr:GDSL-type esterase/lipase family protein [Planctomycetota bacterium]
MSQAQKPKTVPRLTRAELERRGMRIPEVRFRADVRRFAAADRESPPAPGGALFVGDSDIRFWNEGGLFTECFAGLPAANRGFGGARTWETLLFFEELVPPHRPAVIAYCCGDNDIARLGGSGAESAVAGFRIFLELLAARAPEVRRALYLGIHPSPVDEPLWDAISRANDGLRRVCAESGGLAEFVDYNHLLLDAGGRPRPELFRPDRLHFGPELYRALGAFLRPKVEAALAGR